MYWIVIGLAGSSLIVSVTILGVVLSMLRSTRRAEHSGEERLELLRDQQERLAFKREERRMLEEELQWRRSMMDGSERLLLQLPEAPRLDGPPEPEQPRERPWWRRLVGG